jgi:hypothetical protein
MLFSPEAVRLVQPAMKRHRHSFFGPENAFDLNIIGFRRNRPEARFRNLFDDLIGIICADHPGGPLQMEAWPATTDPGSFYLHNPMNPHGCAIVVPGQYRRLWQLGWHHGDAAFVQSSPVKVFRDVNRDTMLDLDGVPIEEGLFGIDGHHAGDNSLHVDRWSAGCQVWKRRKDHDRALELGHAQVGAHPTWFYFTYTVLDTAVDRDLLPLFEEGASLFDMAA